VTPFAFGSLRARAPRASTVVTPFAFGSLRARAPRGLAHSFAITRSA
jgi:hypothetical protein